MKQQAGAGLSIFTVGHSTHAIEKFVEMLRAHAVQRLVDVRTIPKSRHNPQFNKDALRKSLRNRRISYRHMKVLGGLRHTRPLDHARGRPERFGLAHRPELVEGLVEGRPDSPNTGWRNASFRGFADHMQTPEFSAAVDALIKLATEKPTAIMCAEAVPWRCHRSLIADALTVRGIGVRHIYSPTSAKPHALTPMAKVSGCSITYPAG